MAIMDKLVFEGATAVGAGGLSSIRAGRGPVRFVYKTIACQLGARTNRVSGTSCRFGLDLETAGRITGLLCNGVRCGGVEFSIFGVTILTTAASSTFANVVINIPLVCHTNGLLNVTVDSVLFGRVGGMSRGVRACFPPVIGAMALVLLYSCLFSFFCSLFGCLGFRLEISSGGVRVLSNVFIEAQASFGGTTVGGMEVRRSFLVILLEQFTVHMDIKNCNRDHDGASIMVPLRGKRRVEGRFTRCLPFFGYSAKAFVGPQPATLGEDQFLFFPAVCFLATVNLSVVLKLLFRSFAHFVLFSLYIISTLVFYRT